MSIRLLRGDCRATLPTLPERSVQACVTSPPYWGLRSYIADGDPLKPFEIGLEPTPELWIEHLVEAFRALRRVLKDDGVAWLNCGDAYATGHAAGTTDDAMGWTHGRISRGMQGRANGSGLAAKNLMMLPARVAMALQADGWWLRSMIPWLKRNSMPESVTDRPATAVEYVFLLSKSRTYFWDADSVRQTALYGGEQLGIVRGQKRRAFAMGVKPSGNEAPGADATIPMSRNRRNSDWFFESWQGLLADEQAEPLAFVVNPAPYKGAHYATFPPKLVEPMILASTSEKGECPECGKAWVRVTERTPNPSKAFNVGEDLSNGAFDGRTANPQTSKGLHRNGGNAEGPAPVTRGWQPQCEHDTEPVPQTVLDPFAGACTTLMVADRLGRDAIGCELSSDYSDQGFSRTRDDAPLFFDGAMA